MMGTRNKSVANLRAFAAATQKRRAAHAWAIVVSFVATIFAICAGASFAEGSSEEVASLSAIREGSYAATVRESLNNGASLQRALESAGFIRAASNSAPDWVERELFSMSDLMEVFATSDWQTLLLMSAESAAKANGVTSTSIDALSVHAKVEKQMLERGWIENGKDAASAATLSTTSAIATKTFTKREGDCRWAMLTSIQVEGEASTVLRIQHI